MLRQLAVKRLLPQTKVLTPMRRSLVARPLAPCSWSRRDEVLSNWEALRANPNEWFDNRNRKTNPRAPDFVRRDNRSVAIWIDGRDNPEWAGEVLEELDARQVGQGRGDRYEGSRASGDRNDDRRAAEAAKWESLRDNPEEWFDNRNRKTNPKAPDFRRRDDRSVALWLDSYGAPEWVGELLHELDMRQAQRAAAYQQQQGDQQRAAPQMDDEKRAAEMAKWDFLRANPELWFDNRRSKTNPRAPDFKLKEDRSVALWLSSYSLPEYIDELLAELDARYEQRMVAQQHQQQYQQQLPEHEYYEQQDNANAEELAKWESLRDYPEQWFDNRYNKTNPKWPDFRRKDDRSVALWLNSRSVPQWVGELVQQLDVRYQQREAARAANANYSSAHEGVY